MTIRNSNLEGRVIKLVALLDARKKTFLGLLNDCDRVDAEGCKAANALTFLDEYLNVFKLESNLMDAIFEEKVFMVVDLLDTQRNMFADLVKNYDLHRSEDYDPSEMLMTLEEYIKVFDLEREMMQSINYSNIDVHVQEHKFFLQKMKHFRMELKVNNKTLYGTMLTFMKKWLVSHMMKENTTFKDEMIHFLNATPH